MARCWPARSPRRAPSGAGAAARRSPPSTTLRADLDRLPGRRARHRGRQHHARPRPAHAGRLRAAGAGHPSRRPPRRDDHAAARSRSSPPASCSTARDGNQRARRDRCAGIAGRGVDVLNGSDGNVFERPERHRQPHRRSRSPTSRGTSSALSALSRQRRSPGCWLIGVGPQPRSSGNRDRRQRANGVARRRGLGRQLRSPRNAIAGGDSGLIIDSVGRNTVAASTTSAARGDGVLLCAGDGNTVAVNLVERSVGGCETGRRLRDRRRLRQRQRAQGQPRARGGRRRDRRRRRGQRHAAALNLPRRRRRSASTSRRAATLGPTSRWPTDDYGIEACRRHDAAATAPRANGNRRAVLSRPLQRPGARA